jgi:multiple sugar transport system ATP-binding protein
MSNVSVRGASIRYGNHTVLETLDLEIGASEFIVLLGPSGCGKSTLLNAIAGLIDVDSGQIHIGGRNVTWLEPKERGIAMVFQSYALYPRMTVRQNISFGLKVAGMAANKITERVTKASAMLQIGDLLDRRPAELSGGQRQRVAIGRALVRDSGVYLFDEPLSNLDAQLRAELRVEIKRLHNRLGATMIYVTHDQIEALTLADRIAVMKDKKIQQLGTPQDIYLRPANRFVAGFVGSPAMNFLDARVADGGAIEGNGWKLPGVCNGADLGRSITLGIRPEHIHVQTAATAEDVRSVNVRVELIELLGADSLMWCELGDKSISVRLPDGNAEIAVGDHIAVILQIDRINIFDTATGDRL